MAGFPILVAYLQAVQPKASGDGGQLRVDTQQLRMSDGAVLQTATYGSGNAGDLIVHADDFIDLSGTSRNNLFPTGLVAISGGLPGTNFRIGSSGYWSRRQFKDHNR